MVNQEKMSSEQYAYQQLRQALYKRRLAPGTALVERNLCDALGVGRTPIRAVLKRLAEEGFVEIIPNRGAFVISATPRQIADYYEVRVELTILAARKGINDFTEEDFSAMEKIVDLEEEHFNNLNFQEYLDSVGELYQLIAGKSGNPFLEELLRGLYKRISILLVLYDNFYMTRRSDVESVQAHRGMIQALRQRDAEGFGQILVSHCETVLRHLKFDSVAGARIDQAFMSGESL